MGSITGVAVSPGWQLSRDFLVDHPTDRSSSVSGQRPPAQRLHCTFPHCSSCMRANFHPRHLGREIPAVIVLPVGGPLEAVAQRPSDKALPPCSKFCRHT